MGSVRANAMSVEMAIKAHVLRDAKASGEFKWEWPDSITDENASEVWDACEEAHDYHADWLHEMLGEFRGSYTEETGIRCEYSRHYEAKSVAAKLDDGRWVGWTYWYGGGKHGEPEAMPWLDETYLLECVEEEKVVVVRTFERVAP
jgi:hypothetical protein